MGSKIINGIEYSEDGKCLKKCPETYDGTVEIPSTVSSIGYRAFYNCSCITSIKIPSSVVGIGYYAFYGCSGLTSIEIPNSVTRIGHGVFVRCTGLTSLYIPASVERLGAYNFIDCDNQLQVYCEAEKDGEKWDKKWNIVTENPIESDLGVTYGVPRSWYDKFVAQK